MKELDITIGAKLAAARKAAGLTQDQLAEKLDVTGQAVSSWERNEYLPDLKNLILLGRELKISLNTLLAEGADWKGLISDQQPLLARAIEFAAVKHAEQKRKGTTYPYIVHVVEALEIVSRMTEDEELRAAAVLHDTLEDTETTYDELVREFGQRVADLVKEESENKREDRPAEETWRERKTETIRHIREAATEVRMIALGDKLANARAMSRDYRVIGEELWQRFNQKNPVYQGWYYGELAKAFALDEQIRESEAYREYVELCSGLFSKTCDGDGNLTGNEGTDGEDQGEKNEMIPARYFLADVMDEVRAGMPEGTKAWALIMDRTEDPDLLEIQKMAATLDAFLRTEDTGFGDVRLRIVNEPGTDDVSWKRTGDGYALHLCAESGKHWCQAAYQLGYLMMHCLIDHLGEPDQEGISWAEELICETAALELLFFLQANWEATLFGQEDPGYAADIGEYIRENLSDEGTSALVRCGGREELKAINERNLFEDRMDESHDLYHAMEPGDLLTLARVREYEADDLLLYTHYWRDCAEGSGAVNYICRLQERMDGCEIPAGVFQEINLRDSRPTMAQKQSYALMIRSLRNLPGECACFSFLDAGKGEKEQIGLVYYRVYRERDGRLRAVMRVDTKDGIRKYRTALNEDEAVVYLQVMLKEHRIPDTADWEDLTEEAASPDDTDAVGDQVNPEEDPNEFNDLNEFDIMENLIHPEGRESDKQPKEKIRSETMDPETCFPCHICGIADAREAYDSFHVAWARDYGDNVTLEDGTLLHWNHTWDDGKRYLLRCRECGGLMLVQSSEFHSFSDSPDGYYEDWIPVASVEEGDLLNILCDGGDLDNCDIWHLMQNNGKFHWKDGDEPRPCDPEELRKKIREKYAGLNPERKKMLEKLISEAGKAET